MAQSGQHSVGGVQCSRPTWPAGTPPSPCPHCARPLHTHTHTCVWRPVGGLWPEQGQAPSAPQNLSKGASPLPLQRRNMAKLGASVPLRDLGAGPSLVDHTPPDVPSYGDTLGWRRRRRVSQTQRIWGAEPRRGLGAENTERLRHSGPMAPALQPQQHPPPDSALMSLPSYPGALCRLRILAHRSELEGGGALAQPTLSPSQRGN